MSGVRPVPDPAFSGFVRVGGSDDLTRLLAEYGLANDDVQDQVSVRTSPDAGAARGQQDYLVHESLLRSQGEFPCAGDAKGLSFCRWIASEMVGTFAITAGEATARINRQWSAPGDGGRVPRVWIVGQTMVYHETAEFWAHTIYYGPDSRWWVPGARPRPLPHP